VLVVHKMFVQQLYPWRRYDTRPKGTVRAVFGWSEIMQYSEELLEQAQSLWLVK